MAKRRDSTYLDGDHETACLKIKNRNYSGAEGRRELFEERFLTVTSAGFMAVAEEIG